MLVTQNQITLNWNSSFSSKEQNSNETFNLEVANEIEIQSDIKTAKKLEVGGIEYLKFPSSNVEINSAVNSALSQATAVNSAVTSATAVNSALSQTTAVSQATAYGYSVDSKGFMEADFNKAAGLPQDFKIHKSTLDTIVDNAKSETKFFNQLAGSSVSVVNVDVANTIGQYYSLFTQLVGTEKNSFSSTELSLLPAGYKNDKMKKDSAADFWNYTDAIVTHIFSANDMAELEKLQENNPTQRVMIPWKLDFSSQHLKESRNGFDMSVYESNDGYSVENVFVAFIDSHSGLPLKGGNTKFSSEFPKTEFLTEISVDEILAEQKKYDDLLAGVLMMIDKKKDSNDDEANKKLLDSVKAIYERAMV